MKKIIRGILSFAFFIPFLFHSKKVMATQTVNDDKNIDIANINKDSPLILKHAKSILKYDPSYQLAGHRSHSSHRSHASHSSHRSGSGGSSAYESPAQTKSSSYSEDSQSNYKSTQLPTTSVQQPQSQSTDTRATDPEWNAYSYYLKGTEHYKKDNYDEARIAFIIAAELSPKNYKYLHAAGKTLLKIGDYKQAVLYLKVAKLNAASESDDVKKKIQDDLDKATVALEKTQTQSQPTNKVSQVGGK